MSKIIKVKGVLYFRGNSQFTYHLSFKNIPASHKYLQQII